MLAGGEADTDIVQISRVFHTGADPIKRMATRADFDGLVTPGKPHVLLTISLPSHPRPTLNPALPQSPANGTFSHENHS
jgi:hypothetical protein